MEKSLAVVLFLVLFLGNHEGPLSGVEDPCPPAESSVRSSNERTIQDLKHVFLSEEAKLAQIHWHSDFSEAQRESKETGKPIFLLFSGTGWCTPCKRLEGEVLNRPDFPTSFGNQFIFVKMDLPRTPLTSEQMQNDAKAKEVVRTMYLFDVDSVPRIYLIDSSGETYGKVVYFGDGLEGFQVQLNKQKSNQKILHDEFERLNNEKHLSTVKTRVLGLLWELDDNDLLFGYSQSIESFYERLSDDEETRKKVLLYLMKVRTREILALKADQKYEEAAALAAGLLKEKKKDLSAEQNEFLTRMVHDLSTLSNKLK